MQPQKLLSNPSAPSSALRLPLPPRRSLQEGGQPFWELWGLFNIHGLSLDGIYLQAALRQVGKVGLEGRDSLGQPGAECRNVGCSALLISQRLRVFWGGLAELEQAATLMLGPASPSGGNQLAPNSCPARLLPPAVLRPFLGGVLWLLHG